MNLGQAAASSARDGKRREKMGKFASVLFTRADFFPKVAGIGVWVPWGGRKWWVRRGIPKKQLKKINPSPESRLRAA